jgi:hypothetical protein
MFSYVTVPYVEFFYGKFILLLVTINFLFFKEGLYTSTRLWKHTETSMHQTSQKGKWNDAQMAALTSLISGCDTF